MGLFGFGVGILIILIPSWSIQAIVLLISSFEVTDFNDLVTNLLELVCLVYFTDDVEV